MGRNSMGAKLAIAIVSALAVAPAVAMIAWPTRTSAEMARRTIELSGPILGFTQSRERIQVRLVPAADQEQRSEVIVRGGEASQIIPLKHGQTWASARLNAELVDSPALRISVE